MSKKQSAMGYHCDCHYIIDMKSNDMMRISHDMINDDDVIWYDNDMNDEWYDNDMIWWSYHFDKMKGYDMMIWYDECHNMIYDMIWYDYDMMVIDRTRWWMMFLCKLNS